MVLISFVTLVTWHSSIWSYWDTGWIAVPPVDLCRVSLCTEREITKTWKTGVKLERDCEASGLCWTFCLHFAGCCNETINLKTSNAIFNNYSCNFTKGLTWLTLLYDVDVFISSRNFASNTLKWNTAPSLFSLCVWQWLLRLHLIRSFFDTLFLFLSFFPNTNYMCRRMREKT